MNWRDWTIKKLGGHTKQDVAAMRDMCDALADSVRSGQPPTILRDGEWLFDKAIAGPVFVLGDYVQITGCMFWVRGDCAALNISPLSEGVMMAGNRFQPIADETGRGGAR